MTQHIDRLRRLDAQVNRMIAAFEAAEAAGDEEVEDRTQLIADLRAIAEDCGFELTDAVVAEALRIYSAESRR